MDAIDELAQLADSMRQASALLANEYVDENSSSSRRASTFLNVIALGNTVLESWGIYLMVFRTPMGPTICLESVNRFLFWVDVGLKGNAKILYRY
ncbi:dynamin-2A-like [Camellia sinensis]|uniref:dynamin-2A-like n=1 Tax=Camellia sinensis TaxID=4442 RepID=UPI001035F1D5|nr:dynamin-2A-like [Camellia sinensis]